MSPDLVDFLKGILVGIIIGMFILEVWKKMRNK